ncbi:MAG: radical SAM protein, partial [Desulfobulbaceae bacterium]|nr:radical SAM protein [Desulfobulbaceae bacterium]
IRHSLTIVRGCCGNCSFCAIARHQGPVVTCRSRTSILAEVKQVARMHDFKGTISDLGGPTANLYGTACHQAAACKRHDCLYPEICRHLTIDEKLFLDLLAEAAAIPGVKHLFVSSGLRMELLLKTPNLLRTILTRHTPGMMKIAPEHTDPEVLRLMHKPGPTLLADFVAACREIEQAEGRSLPLSPYLIASHPGCTVAAMQRLAATLNDLRLPVRQFQDFTPTPGTLATAMYVSGMDRDTGRPIQVARNAGERAAQREVLEGIRPKAHDAGARPRHRAATTDKRRPQPPAGTGPAKRSRSRQKG